MKTAEQAMPTGDQHGHYERQPCTPCSHGSALPSIASTIRSYWSAASVRLGRAPRQKSPRTGAGSFRLQARRSCARSERRFPARPPAGHAPGQTRRRSLSHTTRRGNWASSPPSEQRPGRVARPDGSDRVMSLASATDQPSLALRRRARNVETPGLCCAGDAILHASAVVARHAATVASRPTPRNVEPGVLLSPSWRACERAPCGSGRRACGRSGSAPTRRCGRQPRGSPRPPCWSSHQRRARRYVARWA